TATIEQLGEGYYYISSKVETVAFFEPRVVERQIFAVRFDEDGRVSSFAHYGLQDGEIIDFIPRKSPTRGKERSLHHQLFKNVGPFCTGGGSLPARGPGG